MNPNQYTVVIEQKQNHFIAKVVELPRCIAQGDTLPDVLDRIKNELESYIDAEELDLKTIAFHRSP